MDNNFKVTDVLAAALNFNFDYAKIKEEMLQLRPFWIYTPPYKFNLDPALEGKVFMSDTRERYEMIDYKIDDDPKPVRRSLRGQHIFYLRQHKDNPKNITKFRLTKNLSTDGWDWITGYRDLIPYTIHCIESLPFEKIGCIRGFITENTFFPTHRDSNAGRELNVISDDYEKCLGLSLIPDTGNVPMSIYSPKEDKVFDVFGNAMLFNDSAFHGVKFTEGIRITLRIFGKARFEEFKDIIDLNQTYLC